jgi:hypothetical protein
MLSKAGQWSTCRDLRLEAASVFVLWYYTANKLMTCRDARMWQTGGPAEEVHAFASICTFVLKLKKNDNLPRSALAAARCPAEEAHAFAMRNLVEEDANLVVPRPTAVALDPAVVVAWAVFADRA